MPNSMSGQDLLTTGQVSAILGCSRTHVVDLCNAGRIPFQKAPVHRRIRRADAEALMRGRAVAQKQMRREELRSLWLNRAIAGKLAADPQGVLKIARDNLARFAEIHRGGAVERWLDEWRRLLSRGPEAVMRTLTSEAPEAVELRQNSPFPGVLSEAERRSVLGSFKEYWHHAA